MMKKTQSLSKKIGKRSPDFLDLSHYTLVQNVIILFINIFYGYSNLIELILILILILGQEFDFLGFSETPLKYSYSRQKIGQNHTTIENTFSSSFKVAFTEVWTF